MKVFISHQKEDKPSAKEIANFLISMGIEVYFDQFDKELQDALNRNDAKGVVHAIKNGVKQSTHMLVLISPNTLSSKWVPYEIGYGEDKIPLKGLTLKGIGNSQIPEYLKTIPLIRNINDIDNYAQTFAKRNLFEVRGYTTDSFRHPLNNIMDK